MEILTGTVILIGLVTLLNLLLSMAIIRRLRQMEESGGSAVTGADANLDEHPAGTPIPAFRATALSGREVRSEDLIGQERVYAFFDTGCSVCKERLTPLVERTRAAGMLPEQVIVVIGDDQGDATAYTELLEGHATVIVEKSVGEVAQAFSLQGVPTVILAGPGGAIARSGTDVNILPSPVRV